MVVIVSTAIGRQRGLWQLEAPLMELLLALAVFIVVDVLALRYGFDSRPLPAVKNDPRRDH